MERQALDDLVDFLAIPVKPDADQVQSIGRDRRNRRTIIHVVVGRKERAGVD